MFVRCNGFCSVPGVWRISLPGHKFNGSNDYGVHDAGSHRRHNPSLFQKELAGVLVPPGDYLLGFSKLRLRKIPKLYSPKPAALHGVAWRCYDSSRIYSAVVYVSLGPRLVIFS